MPIETTYTCDVCGCTETRAQGEAPPKGWSTGGQVQCTAEPCVQYRADLQAWRRAWHAERSDVERRLRADLGEQVKAEMDAWALEHPEPVAPAQVEGEPEAG